VRGDVAHPLAHLRDVELEEQEGSEDRKADEGSVEDVSGSEAGADHVHRANVEAVAGIVVQGAQFVAVSGEEQHDEEHRARYRERLRVDQQTDQDGNDGREGHRCCTRDASEPAASGADQPVVADARGVSQLDLGGAGLHDAQIARGGGVDLSEIIHSITSILFCRFCGTQGTERKYYTTKALKIVDTLLMVSQVGFNFGF
jgi:hypothetical protein